MDMNFTKVSFDGDLDEIEDADELRGIIRKFESAQDSNISEFEDAKDTLEDFEGRVGEAQEFKEELADSLSEISPLSAEEALTYDMARIRELIGEFSEAESANAGEDGGDEGGKLSDMGQRGQTHNEEAEEREFAEKHLGDIDGLNF
jgi:hypothetical protein